MRTRCGPQCVTLQHCRLSGLQGPDHMRVSERYLPAHLPLSSGLRGTPNRPRPFLASFPLFPSITVSVASNSKRRRLRLEFLPRALQPGGRGTGLWTSRATPARPLPAMAAASVPPVSSSGSWDFTCNLEVDYGSEENASIVYKTLAVDKELQPDKVKREMTLSGSKLAVHFAAVEARFLRASLSAFVDLMGLVTKLVEEYGVAKEEHS